LKKNNLIELQSSAYWNICSNIFALSGIGNDEEMPIFSFWIIQESSIFCFKKNLALNFFNQNVTGYTNPL
jgi:hypothetical protein